MKCISHKVSKPQSFTKKSRIKKYVPISWYLNFAAFA